MKMKALKIAVLAAISLFYGLFLARQVNLERMDLGRYIKNGEIICSSLLSGDLSAIKPLLYTNHYSYTNTDFPIVNHHWGCGIPFYLVHSALGFDGLHMVFIYASIVVLLVFFYAAYREAGFWAAAGISLFCLPLIAKRIEIRPEICTYLFGGLFYLLLRAYLSDKVKLRTLLIVFPICEALWVNTHIYFVFGPFIIVCFIIDALLSGAQQRQKAGPLVRLLGITMLAMAANPFGIDGALYPLRVFDDYGYLTAENVSMNPFENFGPLSEYYLHYRLTAIALITVFAGVLVIRPKKFPVAEFILSVTFGVLCTWAIRNFTYFGFFAMTAFARSTLILGEKVHIPELTKKVLYSILGALIVFYAYRSYVYSLFAPFGIGLKPGLNDAAEFIRREKLEGPVFNNFDMGSYLVYHFFPDMRVFVENRPEAYPASFFHNTYIPMQDNEDIWKILNDKYEFNMIAFAYKDLADWAPGFVVRRLRDPMWKCVFADPYFMVFIRNNEKNQRIIEKYAVPESRISITEIEGGLRDYYIIDVYDKISRPLVQRTAAETSSDKQNLSIPFQEDVDRAE